MVWDRKHIEFIRYEEAPWQPLEVPGLAPGLQIRVLSKDLNDGALSGILQIPAGWRQEGSFTSSAPEQLFILSGDLHKGEYTYTEQCYSYRPAGAPHGPMWSENGCQTIVMWDGAFDIKPLAAGAPEPPGMLGCIDTIKTHWQPTIAEGPNAGIMVKVLRQVESNGEMTFITGIMPHWYESRQEHHHCVEESFKITGDMNLNLNLGDKMLMTEECYFYRPPYKKHGPMYTKTGTMSLIRVSSKLVNYYMPLEEDADYLALAS
jgi:hypothetical protein